MRVWDSLFVWCAVSPDEVFALGVRVLSLLYA